MVLIENGSGDLAGLAKMAEFLEARLKNMGFTTRREKALAAPDKPPSNGADLVIGTLRGSGKGGIAVILHTLKILNEAGWKDFHTLTVVFNPDEEIGSRGSGELISSLADQHQTVLSFEPTGAKAVAKTEALLLGAAGGSRVRLEVKLNAGAPISATEIRPLQSC